MTGTQMIRQALVLLGYTDSQGNISGEHRFKSRSITVLNTIYADLYYCLRRRGFVPLDTLDDRIHLPERILRDVMVYGVAAHLAMSESDGDQQQLYIALYNQKRAGIGGMDSVRDVIPHPQ